MLSVVLVFVGAGIGGVLRYAVGVGSGRWLGVEFPWGTLAVNIIGSLVMGLFAGYFAFRAGTPGAQEWRLFLTTGVLGGFTTFSSFSLDIATLWERGATQAALVYGLASLIISILALFSGLWLVRTTMG